MNKYVFDTSALFAYIENEDGYEQIESLILQALDEEIEIFVSIVSCIEVYYITLQEQNDEIAIERLALLQDLPIRQEALTFELTMIIGQIKAQERMSFADCCIAGLAKYKNAILVHKDPEFEQMKNGVKQVKLPYKVSDS
jgi:predicted nucleic acid-binding protein